MADLNYYPLAVLIKTSSANITVSHSVSVVDLLRSQNRGAVCVAGDILRLQVQLLACLKWVRLPILNEDVVPGAFFC